MTILITGGTGYIGSHIAVELLDAGYGVIILDNFYNSTPNVAKRIGQVAGKEPKLYDCDICDKNVLDQVFKENLIDGVIHCAGYKAVGESVSHPLKYYKNNIDSTLNLLETMQNYNVRNLIFSSSATVYGKPNKLPLTEDMEVGKCTNPYGSTKATIEQIIIDVCAADRNFSAVSLRYFNPVGSHPSSLIGEQINGTPNNLMPYILQVAAGLLPDLLIFGNDYPTHDGTGVRDYIHVVDLAKGHVKALEYCLSRTGADVINIGTGKGYSVLEIITAFEEITRQKVKYRITCRRTGDIAECYADIAKAAKVLNWRAELSLQDMCRDAWNWQKNLLLYKNISI